MCKAELCSCQRMRKGKLHGIFHLKCLILDIFFLEMMNVRIIFYFPMAIVVGGLISLSYLPFFPLLLQSSVSMRSIFNYIMEGSGAYDNVVAWLNWVSIAVTHRRFLLWNLLWLSLHILLLFFDNGVYMQRTKIDCLINLDRSFFLLFGSLQ